MISLRKKEKTEELPALVLSSEEGDEWITFPFTVVNQLRHMVAKVTRQETFPKRLALVASLRQEGVTYLSRALGAVMASDMDLNVCVAELNWWWPAPYPGKMPNEPGLADVLTGEATMDEALLHTNLPNLTLLPAGKVPPAKRANMARSSDLEKAIEELTRRYDHTLLDIPAVLASIDAIPLASYGTACCLIVRQGVTPVDRTRTALEDLDHLHNLGVIMNQVKISTPSFILNMVPQR